MRLRRRQVGIAHAEIDDVGAARAGAGLQPVHLLEDVGREPADLVKLFHDQIRLGGNFGGAIYTHSIPRSIGGGCGDCSCGAADRHPPLLGADRYFWASISFSARRRASAASLRSSTGSVGVLCSRRPAAACCFCADVSASICACFSSDEICSLATCGLMLRLGKVPVFAGRRPAWRRGHGVVDSRTGISRRRAAADIAGPDRPGRDMSEARHRDRTAKKEPGQGVASFCFHDGAALSCTVKHVS